MRFLVRTFRCKLSDGMKREGRGEEGRGREIGGFCVLRSLCE